MRDHGAILIQLGNQPFQSESIPSFWTADTKHATIPVCLASVLIRRVLMTSAGVPIVAATRPAQKLDSECTNGPSSSYHRILCLATSYVVRSPTCTNAALQQLGITPRYSPRKPAVLKLVWKQWIMPSKKGDCPCRTRLPSNCSWTLTRSQGDAKNCEMAPVDIPHIRALWKGNEPSISLLNTFSLKCS